MNPATDQSLDTDTIAKSLWARISALSEVGSRTAALAIVELKLATSSAALAIGVAFLLVLMLLTLWSLMLVMGFFLLRQTGLGAVSVTAILLFIQATGCATLALLLKNLASQMRFTHTRQAMRKKLSEAPSNTNIQEETA